MRYRTVDIMMETCVRLRMDMDAEADLVFNLHVRGNIYWYGRADCQGKSHFSILLP